MQRTFARLRTGFLVLFLLASTAVAAHQIYVVRPERQCIERGGWWDRYERVCATPVDITRLTGRKRGEPRRSPPATAASPATSPASPPDATARR